MSAARYVLQKYTKSWGWMPPMPHFLFGMRNILNGDGVVDVVRMALLIIYRVCVWLGVGWAIAYRTVCREKWLRVSFWLL
jgi:hypothetical protein